MSNEFFHAIHPCIPVSRNARQYHCDEIGKLFALNFFVDVSTHITPFSHGLQLGSTPAGVCGQSKRLNRSNLPFISLGGEFRTMKLRQFSKPFYDESSYTRGALVVISQNFCPTSCGRRFNQTNCVYFFERE